MTEHEWAAKLYDQLDVLGDEGMEVKIGRRAREVMASVIKAAVLEEREACARLAGGEDVPEEERGHVSQTALNIAKAIRSRS